MSIQIKFLNIYCKPKIPIFWIQYRLLSDATHDLYVPYNQTRFYEAYGIKGWHSLEKQSIISNEKHPEILPLPMQNGDIDTSSSARAFLMIWILIW